MRVIDADEAKEKMKDTAAYSTHGCLLYLSDVLHKIDECQILDVQSLVHAHWIHQKSFLYGHIVTCSRCGNSLSMEGVNGGRGDANFCPNCGARMDEE